MSSAIIQNDQHLHYSKPLSTCEEKKPHRLQKVANVVERWIERSHQRRQLALLDKHLLEDIGLNEEQAKTEIAKPFWQ